MRKPSLSTEKLSNLCQQIPSLKKAIQVIEDALRKYCGGVSNNCDGGNAIDLSRILVAFNGGKDCTLLLHLVFAVVDSLPSSFGSLRLLYICDSPGETFSEISDFVVATQNLYGLSCITVAGGDMRAALDKVVHDQPEVCAIFMGTRSGDPNAGWMDYFCKTSGGWPEIDLVAPLLHMKYSQVWRIIQELEIPYCSLYNQGYTSVGRRSNTIPNPLLCLDTGEYLPAYKLVDESQERLGRL